MKTSTETDKIYPAFAKMQAEINKAEVQHQPALQVKLRRPDGCA